MEQKNRVNSKLDTSRPGPVNTLIVKVFMAEAEVGSGHRTMMVSITSEGFGPKLAFHVQEEIKR
jgi:hypothetical protein